MKDFRKFVLRGNVVDLAIGVVIGVAFGAVITSLVKDILTPLLGLLNVPDFSRAAIHVGDASIRYGLFINAIVAFLLIAAAVFFFVIKPVNAMAARSKDDAESPTRVCPHCESEIPKTAHACAHCTRDVKPLVTQKKSAA
jgi:large conductance mechanosensitive channel